MPFPLSSAEALKVMPIIPSGWFHRLSAVLENPSLSLAILVRSWVTRDLNE
jgi:hypothetical protein